MDQIASGIYRVMPSKVTPSKYISYFVVRDTGNLLFPCVSSSSTFEADWPEMQSLGGVSKQLLGDMHFATKHNDQIFEEFGATTYCSALEEPDVSRKVKNVEAFEFERIEVAPGVISLPTPGHRPGAVSYLVAFDENVVLFAGDSIWHTGSEWVALANKKNRNVMRATLEQLEAESFSAIYVNSSVTNDVCSVSFASDQEKSSFLSEIADAL